MMNVMPPSLNTAPEMQSCVLFGCGQLLFAESSLTPVLAHSHPSIVFSSMENCWR
jgi:hypothetical protein